MSLFLCPSLHLHPARLLPLHTTFHVASMHAVCCLPLTACSREHTSWTSIHRSGSSPLHSLVSILSKLRATMTRMLCSLVPMACFVLFCTRPSQKAFFFFFFWLPLSRILPNQPATAWAFGYDGKFAFDTIGKGLATMRAHRLATCLPHQSTLSTFCSVLLNQVSLSLHRCMQSIHPTFRLLHFG